jgi:hypothetical protein
MNTSTSALALLAPAGPHILSAGDAARYIGKSEITLRQWRSRGMGPPYIRQGRSINYLKSDLDQYLEEHRCGGSAPKTQPEPQPAEPQPPARRSRGTGHQRKPPRRSGKGGRRRPLR